MKYKIDQTKETEGQRQERLALSGAVKTKVIKDKTKYIRKPKHKVGDEEFV